MPLYPVTGPTQPVVSLADMKKHLRVDHSDDDGLIDAFTAAATQHLDGRDGLLGRALVAQTWDLAIEQFAGWNGSRDKGFYPDDEWRRNYLFGGGRYDRRGIRLPLPPLLEVVSIKYYDDNNAQQTLSASAYQAVGAGGSNNGRVVLAADQSWPSIYNRAEGITVRFRAGYVDTANSPPSGAVPAPIVAAIKLLTANLYEQRGSYVVGQQAVIKLPWAVEALLSLYMPPH